MRALALLLVLASVAPWLTPRVACDAPCCAHGKPPAEATISDQDCCAELLSAEAAPPTLQVAASDEAAIVVIAPTVAPSGADLQAAPELVPPLPRAPDPPPLRLRV